MKKFEYVDYNHEHLAVSMIKWGFLRRLTVSLIYKISRPNMFESPSFVPAFELAIFCGKARRKPVVLIHFADRETAEHAWANLAKVMKSSGLKGATDYVCNIRISLKNEFGKIYAEAMSI
jgi:hypothetical protein